MGKGPRQPVQKDLLQELISEFPDILTVPLVWWAETEFQLSKPLPNNGGTLRDAIENYERATGLKHPEARAKVPAPWPAMYLWGWFLEISQGRPIGAMGGYLPVPPSEILAWCRLTKVELSPWELRTLQQLDAAFLRVQNGG